MGYWATERLIEKAHWLGYTAYAQCEPGMAWRNEYSVVFEKDGSSVEFSSVRDALEYLNTQDKLHVTETPARSL